MSATVLVPWPDHEPAIFNERSTTSAFSLRETAQEPATIDIEEAGLTIRVSGLELPSVPRSIRPVMRSFRELLNLEENWDSYGASRIELRVLEHVARVLWSLGPNRPTPSIYPVNHGGVQLEWRFGTREVEVEVSPEGELSVLCAEESRQTFEADTRLDAEAVRSTIDRLRSVIPEGPLR